MLICINIIQGPRHPFYVILTGVFLNIRYIFANGPLKYGKMVDNRRGERVGGGGLGDFKNGVNKVENHSCTVLYSVRTYMCIVNCFSSLVCQLKVLAA